MTNSTRIRRNYQIQCPACRAGVGQPCKGKLGERLPGVHFQRTTALRRASLAAFRSLYAPLKTAALLVCLLVCTVAVAQQDHALQSAKVISQDIGASDGGAVVMPMGTGLVGVPIVRRSNIVVVETTSQRLTWAETANSRHFVVLPVDGTISFYQDGNWYIVRDKNGKKHKFSLVHMEAVGR